MTLRCTDPECPSRQNPDTETTWFTVLGLGVDEDRALAWLEGHRAGLAVVDVPASTCAARARHAPLLQVIENLNKLPVDAFKCGHCDSDAEDVTGSQLMLETPNGFECPLCRCGTVEYADGAITCRGECGTSVLQNAEGV